MAASGSFKQQCPSCEAMVPIRDRKLIGKKADCPNCKYRFVVEEPPDIDDDEDAAPRAKAPGKKKSEDRAKFKAKQEARGGSRVLLIGGVLTALAVALLGVGAYMFLSSSDKPLSLGGRPAAPPVSTGPAKPQVVVQQPVAFELTNLLPGDTEMVADLHVKALLDRAPIGEAAFATKGAFSKAVVNKLLGFRIDDVERMLLGENVSGGWLFLVIRANPEPAADFKADSIKASLALQPATGGLIGGQEMYEVDVGSWLDTLSRLIDADLQVPLGRPRASRLGVHFYDPKTLIIADQAPLRKFLEDQRQPSLRDLPGAAPGVSPAAGANRYRSIQPSMKSLLDQFHRNPDTFFCLAADMKAVPLQERFKPLLTAFDIRPGDEGEVLGLALQGGGNRDSANLVVGVETVTQDQALGLPSRMKQKIATALPAFAFLNGLEFQVPGVGRIGPATDGLTTAHVDVMQQVRTVQLTLQVTPAAAARGWLLEQLRPRMVRLRALADMARGYSYSHELAAKLKDYAANNGYPMGTVPRPIPPPRLGRPFNPKEEVSWMAQLLPMLGQPYDTITRDLEFGESWKHPRNLAMGQVLVPHFLAASSPPSTWWVSVPGLPEYQLGATHFVGISGVGLDSGYPEFRADPANRSRLGVFGWDRERPIKFSDLANGGANTVVVAQVPPTPYPRPWIAGGGATVMGVPETRSIEPFLAAERGGQRGTHVLMGDGSVRFIAATIDDAVFKAMCTLQGATAEQVQQLAVPVPATQPAARTP